MKKISTIFFAIILTCHLQLSYALAVSSISFFASNNTGVIQPDVAFARLLGEAQNELQTTVVTILQNNHIEQTQSDDILGLYAAENQSITSDNTKVFTTSAYQIISDKKAFAIAQEVAKQLQQESVAVFLPNKRAKIGDIVVYLQSHPYSIQETFAAINKLPAEYSRAFSLHFGNKVGGYENATVLSVEWLGSKLDPRIIQTVFPEEKIFNKNGSAYLIFQDGRKQEL